MKKAKKIKLNTPIEVLEDNLEEIKSIYNREQQVKCECYKCHKSFLRSLRFISFPTFCRACQIEQTAIKNYGSLENMQKLNLEHGKKTSEMKYGVSHFTNREKCKETKKLKYGDEFYTNREKCKETLLKKYGVENPAQIDGVSDKVKQTKLSKYGSATYNNSDLAKQTCIKKYGVENPGCIKATYLYKNIKFDSSWELYFWIYCELNNIPISRATESFTYMYNNKEHIYHPDFNIDGKLFEIKGDQFFKEDGTMQNPFCHEMDGLYEAKHQCGLNNNVVFLTKADMTEIISYVDNIMPFRYIDDFKVV